MKKRAIFANCFSDQGFIVYVWMQECEIFVIANKRHEIQGSITAHSRQSTKENSGFVFVKGKVYGIGDVYLGRANGAYSRVVFANTYFSRTVIPQGWTNWSHSGSTG